MSKSALIILTDNFEEIEAITPIDILRRGEVEVTVASRTHSLNVTGRSGIKVSAECLLEDTVGKAFDLVIIPGGPGFKALRDDGNVLDIVRNQAAAGRLVAAICAAPVVLKAAGILTGKKHTAHFSVAEELPGMLDEDVVCDGNIITASGAGPAVTFALTLVEKLCGYEKALKISHAICAEYL